VSDDAEATRRSGDNPFEALLAEVGLEVFDDDVRADIDAVLSPGQSLEPGVRKRFIDAAGRGTRQWALRHQAALETLLFEARRVRMEDASTVAGNAGIDVDTLCAVEQGELSIQALGPAAVASWALAVDFDRNLLAAALRRTLGTGTSAPAYAGEHDVRLQPEQERFVDDVLQAFDEHSPGRAG
jgi:hypothetical protein